VEALSVLLQVTYFKFLTTQNVPHGPRCITTLSLLAGHEEKVVIRFWIMGIIFALFQPGHLKN
jgi:UDP-N-acetylmuramyl pentapeptide phosphotransferase/UDP-N-acetylglucosamine-1-phosphate transferase